MEYYAKVLKKNEVDPFVVTYKDLQDLLLGEKVLFFTYNMMKYS